MAHHMFIAFQYLKRNKTMDTGKKWQSFTLEVDTELRFEVTSGEKVKLKVTLYKYYSYV